MMHITFDDVYGNSDIFMNCLETIIGENTNSFIDLGCCHASHTGRLKQFKERKYIDVLERQLDFPEEQQYFQKLNILELPEDKKYDTSFALDVIEHLYESDGWKLLQIMGNISNKQILFTPLDAWMMTYAEDKNPESHRSLWKPQWIEKVAPEKFAFLIFPQYHNSLAIGAFFFWHTENIKEDFER